MGFHRFGSPPDHRWPLLLCALVVSPIEVIIRLVSVSESLRRQPQWLVLLEALILVGLIGGLDYATGWEWSFFAPFALPIAWVTWKAGWRLGFACAALCALAFWVAHFGRNPYHTNWGFAVAVVGRWFYFAVLVVAVAALKAKRKQDRERIESLERAQQLETRILRTSEEVKQRIGQDLHDSLGPHLAAVGYAATFLADELRASNRPEAAKAGEIRDLVAEAVSLTRALARGIFPGQMGGTGLALALEELARTTSGQTGRLVSFYETGHPQVENPENGMHLFRIAREALNNSLKHADARKITIILNGSEASLRLAVADDGKGMTPSANNAAGMGLRTMQYRARALGGELKIESHPGEGTVVSCEFPNRPLPSAAPAA